MKKERILELKIYKRRSKIKKHQQRKKASDGVFPRTNIKVQTNLIAFFRKKGFISTKYITDSLTVPKLFSFEENSDDSITFFKCLLSSYLLTDTTTIVDFKICERIDITNAMLLKVIIRELLLTTERYNSTFYNYTNKKLKYKKSECNKLNRSLFALKITNNIEENELKDAKPEEGFLYLGLMTNWQEEHITKKIQKVLSARKSENS